MRPIILIVLLFILLPGCSKKSEFDSVDISNVIFQYEYTNSAWGYSHNGWMMENTGIVKRFQKSAKWVFPDKEGYISESDMKKNLSACDSTIAKVSTTEFTSYSEKALSCADGPMSTPTNPMADAGEHVYAFYQYDGDNQRYKRIILSMIGDWQQINLSPYSTTVVEWMSKIR